MQQNDPVPCDDIEVDVTLRKQNGRVNVVEKTSFDVIGIDQPSRHD